MPASARISLKTSDQMRPLRIGDTRIRADLQDVRTQLYILWILIVWVRFSSRTSTIDCLHAVQGAADLTMIVRAIILIVFCIALGYALRRLWWRRNVRDAADKKSGFRPRIGFTQLDGMVSLSILLENESARSVWAEEIEILLSGLSAEEQASLPSHHEIQKIRQMVRSGDVLPISLCEAIYKAAGNPQRSYSCVLSSILRYRIGEELFVRPMENYRIRMKGLTVTSVHRERKPVPPFQVQEKSQEIPAAAAKLK